MKGIKLLDRRFEEVFLFLSMVAIVGLIFYQVVSRYVFNDSITWSEELARYIHIWQVWLGASFAIRMNQHIKVEVFRDLFNRTIRKVIDCIALFLWFFLAGVLAFYGTQLVLNLLGTGQLTPAMRIPIWIAYAAIPVGGILMCVRLIQQMILLFRPNTLEEGTS
ncbi:TRAP transporter small permease [Pontibacillus salicampi]|uniref:TRAP transporter small permease n=1 Tax=Pontibacillus salicampi TaxID=1449801 RepID=A0ABV6LQJ3_9BACI